MAAETDLSWTAEVRAQWNHTLEQEALAQVALRGALSENPGPWNWRELEVQAAERSGVAERYVHGGLWGLINNGQAFLTGTGIERGVLPEPEHV